MVQKCCETAAHSDADGAVGFYITVCIYRTVPAVTGQVLNGWQCQQPVLQHAGDAEDMCCAGLYMGSFVPGAAGI